MSKAVEGAALIAGAVTTELASGGALSAVAASMLVSGVAMEAGAIADALLQNRGMGITTRQPASFRQAIYGQQRIGGIEIYRSTTGSNHDQYNWIIVLAGHEVDSLVNLYLDGRQVHWAPTGPDPSPPYPGYTVRNGIGFGGAANSYNYVGPGGPEYNFGGTGHAGMYCEARFGDQAPGDYITALTANDANWGPDGLGNTPYCGGCCIIYLKVEYNPSLFPGEPEIRVTVNGKNNIYDPRTGLSGFTNNWALIMADVLTDPVFGLGDLGAVNTAQLVAAANVCDEQVDIAIGGTEARYCCDWHFDTGAGPGDVLQTMMPAAAGRLSRIGGEWFIWPAYWQGPSFSFDESVLTNTLEWTPYRSFRELINRVNGTYIAPTYPWNTAGNLYDSNGWYYGSIQNNFPFAWQPTNYPQYAEDVLHGYTQDLFLEEDSGVLGAWDSGTTYALGDAVSYSGALYQSQADGNTGNTPSAPALASGWSVYSGNPASSNDWVSTTSYNSGDVVSYLGCMYQSTESANLDNPPVTAEWWLPWAGTQLPLQLVQNCVLSVAQAQRVAKITLLRNRQQGSGTIEAHLDAWQMQPLDVMQFSFPAMSWVNKQLEVVACKFSAEPGRAQGDAQTVRVQFGVQETDESVYEWATSEELSVYDVPGNPAISPYTVDPPTSLSLLSDSGTAVIGADGINQPRILADWVPSDDVLVTQTDVQYRPQTSPASNWIDYGMVSASTTSVYISGLVSGVVYDVQIQALRASGAASIWVEASVTAEAPNSLQETYVNNPQFALSQPTATTIDLAAVDVSFGGAAAVSYNARTFTISAPSVPTVYYVTIADPTQQGDGSPELAATCQTSNALVGVAGNTYMGCILALPGGSAVAIGPGGWPAPQSFQVVS